jgi:Ser/Thr protein kinase RdoA (MazF antagonist)
MMRLSILCTVDRTVDAQWGSPIAAQIAGRWEHDEGSVRFFRSSANFVYRLQRGGRPFYLRFADSSERTRKMVVTEVDILQSVAARGMAVTTPVPSSHGHLVETVRTELGTFHAVVFGGMEGAQLEIDDLDDLQFMQWGAALGRLHSTLEGCAPAAAAARRTWREHLVSAGACLPEGRSAVRTEYERIASSLEVLPATRDSYGLIHSDFELDNLYWQDRTIGIGDFDECFNAWHVMDVALALRDLFPDRVDLNNSSFLDFVRGYRTQRPLADDLVAELPLFLRTARLLGHARLVRSMDLPPHAGDPAWLQALRSKFERLLTDYRASLENQS